MRRCPLSHIYLITKTPPTNFQGILSIILLSANKFLSIMFTNDSIVRNTSRFGFDLCPPISTSAPDKKFWQSLLQSSTLRHRDISCLPISPNHSCMKEPKTRRDISSFFSGTLLKVLNYIMSFYCENSH